MERAYPQLGTQTETTGSRILAWLVDAIIVFVSAVVVGSVLDSFQAFIFILGGGSFVYHTYFEAKYGKTFGKELMNIVVVLENGDPCDLNAAAIRNVLRVVDSFLFYLVGMVVILATDDNQRLGDLVGDTIVTKINTEPSEAPFRIKLHHDDDSDDRYVEIINASGEEIELSRGELRTESGSVFRFPQDESIHRPDHSKAFYVPVDFDIRTGSDVTLVTQNGDRYDVSWDSS